MSDAKKIPGHIRLMAEQAGLTRALELFPEQIVAAVERGLRPLGDPPGGLSPTAHPAPLFDPTKFEREP